MNFSIIVAINEQNGIGKDGKIPWYKPEDLSFFKESTRDSVVIMGRKTFESLKCKPLKDRVNIIITNTQKYENVYTENSLPSALEFAFEQYSNKKIFVIGGERIYKEAMRHPMCNYIWVSKIKNNNEECDTFFDYEYVKQNYFLLNIVALSNEVFVESYVNK